MPTTHLVVDGSNIATEGRSLPSLQQLLEAVDAVTAEFDHANVTVIVDATFGHRIDASERDQYEEKVNSGQIITPPAGVIGRGDAFILEVADRADAIILSNDSFQEFHGTYDWLFQEGRLLGGKHVPGVGWIFLARSPVRGPTSRRAVSDAKRKRRGSKTAASKTPASSRPSKSSSSSKSTKSSRSKSSSKSAQSSGRSRAKAKTDEPAGRKRGGKEPEPYNEPLPFIEFVGAHPVGSVIEAEVEQFASHGAYVLCDGTRAYISLKSISDPPPRSAREVFELGETREFVVKAIDTPRRGIDLAMPGMALDAPEDDETDADDSGDAAIEVEDAPTAEAAPAAAPVIDDGDRKLSVSQRRKLRAQQQAEAEAAAAAAAAEADAPARKAASRTRARAAAKKAAPDQKTTDRKATSPMATKKAASKKKAAAKKAATKKKAAPAKKATAKKAAAKKSSAKKATTKKAAAKKSSAKKATTKKAAAKKSPAKKATTKKAAAKKSPAKKATTKKAAAKKSPAKKSPAKKAASKRATKRS